MAQTVLGCTGYSDAFNIAVGAVAVSPVSRHIVLMCTNVINLLNRVLERDSLTFFVLHRTKCKAMRFERERFSDVTT